jgi:hypothetical protein
MNEENIKLVGVCIISISLTLTVLTLLKRQESYFLYEEVDEIPSIDPFNDEKCIHVGNGVIESNEKIPLKKVMHPCQNLHDVVIQMILLESHLYDPERRCLDCINKHFLTICGLLEESHSLASGDHTLPVPTNITEIEKYMRSLHMQWCDSDKSARIRQSTACAIRPLRKALMEHYGKPLC